MSHSGAPTLTGGRPAASPVIDINPDIPCAMRSNPPLSDSGPVRPNPVIVA